MAKKVFQNPGKIIRDDSGKPILDKNGNYVYTPQSGRADLTMAPHEYLMALPENAIGDLLFKGVSKLASPLVKPIASKAITRVGEFSESKYNDALNRFKKDIFRENSPNYSTKETDAVINSIKNRLKTKEGISRLKNLNREDFNIDNIKLIKDNTDYGYSAKTILGKNIIGLNENLPSDAIAKVLRHEIEHDLQKGTKTNIDNLLENLELRRVPEQMPNNGYRTAVHNENVPGYDIYDKLSNKKKSTDYFYSGSGGLEKSPMLGELQQYLIDNKLISHPYAIDEITPDKIKEVFTDRMFKEGDYPLRIFDIMKPTENNYKLISEGLNKMISTVPVGLGLGAYKLNENNNDMNEYKSGGWIQKAVNPKHRGYCTPMTKSTCTPRRKALAKRFKSGDLSHAGGGKLIIPSGVVPIFSTEYEDGGVMYFLGGSTGNKNNEAMVGGAAQLGLGIATGDPGSIVSGAAGFLTGNIKNMGTVLKDKDSSLLEKGLSLVNPIAGGIFANQARKRENEWNESANMFKERNSMLGIKANGGSLTEFNNGGSHETNQLGGIPQGVAPDGQVNKVEQGETKWQDYIFSDRLMIDQPMADIHNLPKTVVGKTFADASKKLSKISKERPNDPISKGTLDSYMNHLMMANDDTKIIEESNTMAMGGHIYASGNRLFKRALKTDAESPLEVEDWMKDQTLFGGTNANNISALEGSVPNKKLNLDFLKDSKNLRYAPIAFDALAATGLFGKTPTPTEYSPTLISQPGYLTPEQIDEQTMRSAIDTSYNTGISSLAEASGGSGAALRTGITGLSSGYARTLGEAFSNANRANIEQKQAAKQFNLQQQGNIATQNVNAINQAELYNNQIMNAVKAKNYEDRMSYLAKGAEGLGDIGYEQRLMEIMPRIYGYSHLGEHAPTVKKCGGRLRLKNHKK